MSAVDIFAWLWIAYLTLVFMIVIGVIIWAKRTGQFTRQPRASRLPLEIDEPSTPKDKDHVSRPA
jgi:cbb3-type cytochrome oxidase subunit 3